MKFDSIIIGGGLTGLVAGISLQSKGKKCLIVSAGQSALHFFSGSFELCSAQGDYEDALATLPSSHPYSRMGVARTLELASGVKDFFLSSSIKLSGEDKRNHFRITPMGVLKPAWLTLDGYASVPSDRKMPWKKVLVANVGGFLDFHSDFLMAGLDKEGVECIPYIINIPELDRLRTNPTEMRSTNIARALTGNVLCELASQLSKAGAGCDAILLPAVLGLNDPENANSLKARMDVPVEFVATLPPSVPGIRTQLMLKAHFQSLGGTFLMGDTVNEGVFEGNQLKGIKTVNHADMVFQADNFILATGSFFSRGIKASSTEVFESVFGLDVDYTEERPQWYSPDVFEKQPYMEFGVRTDDKFRVSRDGNVLSNVYAAGSVLSGFNGLKDGCGAGVSILTALDVADRIANGL